jgi:ribonuclease III
MDIRRTVATHRARVLIVMDANRAEWLTGLLGQAPFTPELFDRALTHGSTGKPDYQRLEFLGDRVLGLIIAEALYARFPDETEGMLSHRLNSLVAGSMCAEIARAIDLAAHMKLGKQARDDGAHGSNNVLGDVMEAIIGALFIDQGLETARNFILAHWSPLIEAALNAPKHPKSALQEYCAANGRKVPEYTVTRKEGPPHAMRFEVAVTVKGFDPVSAEANSKQAAETAAALAFLEANT